MKKDNQITESDIFYMKRALRLAEKARGMTSPNPMVGAVLVKDGKILAEDFHKRAGEPHAEALVLNKAGEKAKNSILYVTLEPCCHTDKRTPPCSRAIINSGIRKIFVAMRDPNPKVSGKGIAELRNQGITIIEGLLEDKAKRLNEAYCKYIATRMPFVTLKAAMTLDGKIATPEGQSKWITGEMARNVVHRMRCNSDAIMTAIGTVKADNPELTARIKCGRQPLRIIIDPDLETPIEFKVCKTPPGSIFVTSQKQSDKKSEMHSKGMQFIECEGNKVDLKRLMEKLGSMGITSVMIEAGSSFNAAALKSGIVDKVVFFIAPKIILGRQSIPVVGGETFLNLQDSLKISEMTVRKIGEDIMIEGYLIKK